MRERGSSKLIPSSRPATRRNGSARWSHGHETFSLLAASDILSHFALDHRWTSDEVQAALEPAARATGAPRKAAGELILRDALPDPRLLEYPPRTAVETLLRL